MGCDPGGTVQSLWGRGESLLYAVFDRKGTFFVYHLLTKYGAPFTKLTENFASLTAENTVLTEIVNKSLKWEIFATFSGP